MKEQFGVNGMTEEETNLNITLKVQKLLEESGATVLLTRSDENAIYDLDKETLREKKVSDIKNRAKIGNEGQADIFVSIHLNKGDSDKYNGWQTFYRSDDENGKRLAECIQESIGESVKTDNHRKAHDINNVYLIKNVEIPISIVECGFLSNPQEGQQLLTDEYQNKLAWGIYNGILKYFN
ncbi:MAG: N-acetylmuramoyl-L-alanine amidase [Clostridia bacterium]|jgi:N-acetylmuramoyl-L-alanine amidase|nr:N-acetylmuramoyl-L-alanine amidase [Clostridia bacterium]